MKLFMGIEGVTSRYSVAVLSDEEGNIISSRRLDMPLNLHTLPRYELRNRLWQLIQEVLERADVHTNLSPSKAADEVLQNVTLCIGLSGATFDYNARVDVPRLFQRMELSFHELICTPDTHIILPAHTQSNHGSVITCTMGSMAYVASASASARVGGWGPALGDEGSGYWMGRAVLHTIAEEADLEEPNSILWEEVREFLNNPQRALPEWRQSAIMWRMLSNWLADGETDLRTAIFSFAHNRSMESAANWRSLTSGLVIPLMRAWDRGDESAKKIILSAAAALTKQFLQACEKAGVPPNHGPLVPYGGVFTHNPQFRTLVIDHIKSEARCQVNTVFPGEPAAMRPAFGALLLALGESKTGQLRLPSSVVIQRVLAQHHELRNDGAFLND